MFVRNVVVGETCVLKTLLRPNETSTPSGGIHHGLIGLISSGPCSGTFNHARPPLPPRPRCSVSGAGVINHRARRLVRGWWGGGGVLLVGFAGLRSALVNYGPEPGLTRLSCLPSLLRTSPPHPTYLPGTALSRSLCMDVCGVDCLSVVRVCV